MRNKLLLILIILISLLSSFCNPSPDIKKTDSSFIDILSYPKQELTKEIKPFVVSSGKYSFKITPKASYSISAKVVSAKTYSSDWNSKIAQVDLALIWGDLVRDKYRKFVEFSQKNRWYYYRYYSEFPGSKQFIIEHSANNHMIPSTENIKKALKHISVDDNIRAKGYLVKVDAEIDGKRYWWNSSLSRKDSGNNSCELFYVLELKVNENIY